MSDAYPKSASYWNAEVVSSVEIPVARPRLPPARTITPYLERIDASRWYSNGGPLVQELEARLAARADFGNAHVATVCNATIGIALALQAGGAVPGTYCMVPAWTFAATAHAVVLAGLVPWIVDVSPESWALEAPVARDLLLRAPGRVSAVVPVAPFGAPVDPSPWEGLRDETGVVVVIDSAAAFDTVVASSVPSVVSLHATKLLGVGEGGYVLSTDSAIMEGVQRRANFGFWNSRQAMVPAVNGKISEYAAAVGLAALDSWPATRAHYLRVGNAYRTGFAGRNNLFLQCGFGEDWVATTVSLAAPMSGATNIGRALGVKGIGSRRWWGGGLHRHAAFANFPRTETVQTDRLVESVIGLPCWPDLPDRDIARICDIAASAH